MWMWNPNLAGKLGLNPLEIKFIKENLGADLKTVGVVMKVFKLSTLCYRIDLGGKQMK